MAENNWKLKWDQTGERLYETGLRQGVVYPQNAAGAYPKGVAWNGLTAVTESPSGADPTDLYADDGKYLTLRAAENFGATIEAYTYPDEFAECDGSAFLTTGVKIGQQPRKAFGLCYRTVIGNDVELDSYGYKLHLIYGATVNPSERAFQTINDSPEAITFSWEMSTVPVSVTGYKPTAYLEIDSKKVDATKLRNLENILYGTTVYTASEDPTPVSGTKYFVRSGSEGAYVYTEFTGDSFVSGTTYYVYDSSSTDARLPLPDEVLSVLTANG